ncbi:MAG: DUF4129 domain-containing protein, partial [Armatimonadota bacterium]
YQYMRRLVWITLLAAMAVPLWAQSTAARVPVRPSPEQLRSDVKAILSRPEYNQGESQWLEQWAYRLIRSLSVWYREHLASYFERLHEVSPVAYWAIVGVAAAAMVALLYHIYLTLRSAFGTTGRRRRQGAPLPLAAIQSDPEVLLQQADAAAAKGDFAEALRRLYLALVRNLDRHDILRFDRSHTNYEYLRQARDHEAVAGPLAALTDRAEAIWYGHQQADRADYDLCRRLAMAAWQGEAAPASP